MKEFSPLKQGKVADLNLCSVISYSVVVITKETIIMPQDSPASPAEVYLGTDINKCIGLKLYPHAPSECRLNRNTSVTHLLQSYLEDVLVTMQLWWANFTRNVKQNVNAHIILGSVFSLLWRIWREVLDRMSIMKGKDKQAISLRWLGRKNMSYSSSSGAANIVLSR